MFKKLFIAISLILPVFMALPHAYAATTWQDVANETNTYLNKAMIAYREGDIKKARSFVDKSYFESFETQGMEAAVGQTISIKRVYEIEGIFRKIKKQMIAAQPSANIQQDIDRLKVILDEDASILDGGARSNPYTMFFSSFLIIFREGVEAILIVGAIITYLIKSGNKDKIPSIYYGILAAIILSVITWAVLTFFFEAAGFGVELIEGITLLLAMVILFTVSHWLLSKAQAQIWQKYIEGKIKMSVTKGSLFALSSAGFLAVYREGAEIVFFYKALVARAASSFDVQMLAAGFAAGVIALLLFYTAYRAGSVRIPIKPFFIATGLLLYILAFIFAGEGINKLQIAGIIGSTDISNVPVIGSLGIYPTVQTIAIQLILLVALVSALLYQRLKIKREI